MTITLYSDDFDEVDSISRGFSGRVFVEDGKGGREFRDGSLSENIVSALKFVSDGEIPVEEILFCYRDGEEQLFRRFRISG